MSGSRAARCCMSVGIPSISSFACHFCNSALNEAFIRQLGSLGSLVKRDQITDVRGLVMYAPETHHRPMPSIVPSPLPPTLPAQSCFSHFYTSLCIPIASHTRIILNLAVQHLKVLCSKKA